MKRTYKQNLKSQPVSQVIIDGQQKVEHDDDCPFSTEEQELHPLTEPQAIAVLKVNVFALAHEIALGRSERFTPALRAEVRGLFLACNDGRLPQSIEDQQRLKQYAERLRELFLKQQPDGHNSRVM